MAEPLLFADLLATKLAWDVDRASTSAEWTIRTLPFEAGTSASSARIQAGRFGEMYHSNPVAAGRPVHRRAPVLTSKQREALSVLRQLGAPLDDDFDRTQLKRAFRRLALMLHPDRHPGADPRHSKRLGASFALLCQAYRTLNGLDSSAAAL